MFLSKTPLDPARRQTRKMLGSPQVMHAMVERACAGDSIRDIPGRVLWRVDSGPYGTDLYVVSPERPDLAQIIREASPAGGEAQVAGYTPFLERLTDGERWAFRLTANPVRSESRGKGDRGKRYGHVTARQQGDWLMSRAERSGFSLEGIDPDVGPSSLVVRRERPVFNRRRPDGEHRDRVTINRVVFEGALRVTDADLLRRVLVGGLGPSKAYGCGLMTLARPRG